MKLNYQLDISEESSSILHTPRLISQQLPFYVHTCGHFYAGKDYFTEREEQDNYLLIYTVSGEGYLMYRGREYVLKPGHVFFINCHEFQYYKTGSTGNWELRWIHFNGSACKCYFDMINEDSLKVVQLNDVSEINRHMNEIVTLIIKNDINTDIMISMLLTNIITELSTTRNKSESNRNYAQHISMLEKIIDYICCHYKEDIKIKDLLKTAHLSEFYFMRLFKKHTGVSTYEYITNYRINKSKMLLKETEQAIYQIAAEVGFSNVNNYIRDFKKVVGTTPLKFRNYWVS